MLYGVSDGGSATLERIAANDAVVAYGVHETDAGRSYLAVTDRDRGLWLLGADRLEILHRWELGLRPSARTPFALPIVSL